MPDLIDISLEEGDGSQSAQLAKEPKPLTRKEAIMMGYPISPMTREEVLLYPQAAAHDNFKVFTRDEALRMNCYERTSSGEVSPLDAPIS